MVITAFFRFCEMHVNRGKGNTTGLISTIVGFAVPRLGAKSTSTASESVGPTVTTTTTSVADSDLRRQKSRKHSINDPIKLELVGKGESEAGSRSWHDGGKAEGRIDIETGDYMWNEGQKANGSFTDA